MKNFVLSKIMALDLSYPCLQTKNLCIVNRSTRSNSTLMALLSSIKHAQLWKFIVGLKAFIIMRLLPPLPSLFARCLPLAVIFSMISAFENWMLAMLSYKVILRKKSTCHYLLILNERERHMYVSLANFCMVLNKLFVNGLQSYQKASTLHTFIQCHCTPFTTLFVYVDDFILVGNNLQKIEGIKAHLM